MPVKKILKCILALLISLMFTSTAYADLPAMANPTPTTETRRPNTHALTVTASGGGAVSVNNSAFARTHTLYFEYGDRISISARPDRHYYFDRWSYNWGETTHEFREDTTFRMPARDVIVTARFFYDDWDWRDWDWRDRDRWWDWDWRNRWDRDWRGWRDWAVTTEGPSLTLPDTPRPAAGVEQRNDPATNTVNFTISVPGIRNSHYWIGISGLPDGLTAPMFVFVHDEELHLNLPGLSGAAPGTYTVLLALFDDNGLAVTVPILLTLTI